jgi:hypothetical protein
MAINVQEPHEMAAPIDTHARKRCAQLLGAMLHSKAGEPAPQRLHFRRAVEPQESAKCGRVFLLEMLGPFDAQQRQQKCQQSRAQTIEDGTDVTVELAADPKQPALDQTRDSQQHRQLAYLGLLDDAAPLFREGSSVPGVGVGYNHFDTHAKDRQKNGLIKRLADMGYAVQLTALPA